MPPTNTPAPDNNDQPAAPPVVPPPPAFNSHTPVTPPPSPPQKNSSFISRWGGPKLRLLVFILVFAGVGGYFIINSFAASNVNKEISIRKAAGHNAVCDKIGKKVVVSAGANAYCHGPITSGPTKSQPLTSVPSSLSNTKVKTKNVSVSAFSEDVSPNGTRGYGQSETAVAAAGKYVVEAWNDSTSFYSPICSFMNKDQGTGLGFSSDGGVSFTDLGGLPNTDCANWTYAGDPSVAAYVKGGKTYFFISSLIANFQTYSLKIGMDVCQVVPFNGSTKAKLDCSGPFTVADGGMIWRQK